MKNIKIICTLGPSSFKKKTLDSLKKQKLMFLELIYLIQIKVILRIKFYI